jgi:protein-L-isoaspartate(D-aspartate) O-methyltransferase
MRHWSTGFILLILLSTPSNSAFQGPPPNNPEQVMRAWTCHGRNQHDLVDRLRQARILKTPAVMEAMNQVDRLHYTPEGGNPYQDSPQVLGWGQTISAPHMHAHALEEIYPYLQQQRKAHPTEPLKILDVGCGSGYLTACFGRWFQEQPSSSSSSSSSSPPSLAPGSVWGIDIYPQLVRVATENIRKADADLLDSLTIQIKTTNGWKGLPEEAPFDAIHVGASAADFPHELCEQLKPGGVMIVPVGPQGGTQYLYRVQRLQASSQKFDPKEYEVTKLLGVRYVPLIEDSPGNR